MDLYYILTDDKKIESIKVRVDGKIDIEKFDKWMEFFSKLEKRRIGYYEKGNIIISTVFLGIDHNFFPSNDKTPILFETVVKRDNEIESIQRYKTYDDALTGHRNWCNNV